MGVLQRVVPTHRNSLKWGGGGHTKGFMHSYFHYAFIMQRLLRGAGSAYLEGQGLSKQVNKIARVTSWVIGASDLVTRSR